MVAIEHNLEVPKAAHQILDLGLVGGVRGGKVVAQGTREEVASGRGSYTG